MGHIQKAYFFGDITDAQWWVFEQFFCFFDSDVIEYFREILARMFVQQFAQVPLADIYLISHIGEFQFFSIIFFYVG